MFISRFSFRVIFSISKIISQEGGHVKYSFFGAEVFSMLKDAYVACKNVLGFPLAF